MRFLRRVLLIEPGEGRWLLVCGASFFLLLSSYYIIRPIRDQMGIAGGVKALPWLMTATLVTMIVVNPIFAILVSRLPRRRFIPITYRFFAVNLLVFYGLLFLPMTDGAHLWLGRAFYVWSSVFNLFVISIFWSTMADAHTPAQSRRLFGPIGVGGTLGAIVGAASIDLIGSIGDPRHLLPVSALLLEAATLCFLWMSKQGRLDQRPSREPGSNPLAGLKLLWTSRTIRLIAIYIFLFTLTGTVLYLEQSRIIEAAGVSRAEQTRLFARIDLVVNGLTLLLQGLATGRIVLLIGVPATLLILPLITVAGFVGLATQPSVALVAIFNAGRRALHYSIDRPVREMLFTALGPDERYKAKSLIDTFIYRGGDAVGAWSVPATQKLANVSSLAGLLGPLAGSPTIVPIFAAAASAVWLTNAVMLGARTRRASAKG